MRLAISFSVIIHFRKKPTAFWDLLCDLCAFAPLRETRDFGSDGNFMGSFSQRRKDRKGRAYWYIADILLRAGKYSAPNSPEQQRYRCDTDMVPIAGSDL
jgi:hypothetical protein